MASYQPLPQSTTPVPSTKTADRAKQLQLALTAAALLAFYSLYGLLQEKLYKTTYGGQNDRFTSTPLLILFNRIFSISAALAIIALQAWRAPASAHEDRFRHRIRPRFRWWSYALVAGSNFVATSCQYEALRFVSFTTAALAKTCKTIPVLVVSALVYHKTHKGRERAAAAIILIGAATYLFSNPVIEHGVVAAGDEGEWTDGLLGAACLAGYLFADGLTSTTQQHVFGKNPAPGAPFGPESPVLDQMIHTNAFAALFAVLTLLASLPTNSASTMASLSLALRTPALLRDILALSAVSAAGLLVLLHSVASFGALTTSTIMTARQFAGILLNAGVFGNVGKVRPEGWLGVLWVASGVWVKMDKSYERVELGKGRETDVVNARKEELEGLAVEKTTEPDHDEGPRPVMERQERTPTSYLRQYGIPLAVPVIVVAVFSLLAPSVTTPAFTDFRASASIDVSPAALTVQDPTNTTLPSDVQLDAGRFGKELHDLVSPTSCSTNLTTETYSGHVRTGLVSFPRSGNSMLRGLVERTTGYRTSSIYCDTKLRETFLGECDHKTTFLVKTHFPALPRKPVTNVDYYKRFDRVVHLARNPLDAVVSWYHLERVGRDKEGKTQHGKKLELSWYGSEQREAMLELAARWAMHSSYWMKAPVHRHFLRYEDLTSAPVPAMLSLLAFLVPVDSDHQPSLADLACMVERQPELEAYASKKPPAFATWEQWDPSLRREVLEATKVGWCAFGYGSLLKETRRDSEGAEDLCSSLSHMALLDSVDRNRV